MKAETEEANITNKPCCSKPVLNVNSAQSEEPIGTGNLCWGCLFPLGFSAAPALLGLTAEHHPVVVPPALLCAGSWKPPAEKT